MATVVKWPADVEVTDHVADRVAGPAPLIDDTAKATMMPNADSTYGTQQRRTPIFVRRR